MNDDATLLRRYAEEGSNPAFTELVCRHVDLVYGAALRRTAGDAHRAADVAQQVFIALAREARSLSRHTVLSAWLHTATRNAALNLMISEQRRQARELAAHALEPATTEAHLEWDHLRPVLDSAIDELPESDRAAVVLRFLEQRPFGEIGDALRVSEDAARVRTHRALDKLRDALSRRGITSTAAALGALVSSQPLLSAPAGLAATLATRALTTTGLGLVAAGTTATFMSLKLLTTATLTALAAFGAGAYFGFSRDFDAPPPPPIEAPQHSQLIASLRKENLSLRAEVDVANARLAAAQRPAPAPVARPVPAAAPQPVTSADIARSSRQKAILNNLRQLAAAITQFTLENKRPPASLDEIVGDTKYIRRLIPVHGENYAVNALLAGGALSVTDSEGQVVTYDPSAPKPPPAPRTPEMIRADELNERLRPSIRKALEAYQAANNGKPPAGPEAIVAYFATPQEGADFVELIEAQKAAGRYPSK